jgi:hypothetical protein
MGTPDPRAVASVDALFRTVPAVMIGDRDDEIRRTNEALAMIEHAFKVNGVRPVTDEINPGALLDAATDPSVSTAEYEAMVEAKYPEMKDAA